MSNFAALETPYCIHVGKCLITDFWIGAYKALKQVLKETDGT